MVNDFFIRKYLIKKSYTGSFMLNESSKIVQASTTSAILLKLLSYYNVKCRFSKLLTHTEYANLAYKETLCALYTVKECMNFLLPFMFTLPS